MEEQTAFQEALVADVLRQLEQTAFHGAKKMSTQLYCALHATVYGGPPWPGDDRTHFLQALYEQYSSEAQAVAERSVARLAGQQHGERYAQALFGELSSFAYYARVSSNLFSKARGRSFLQDSQLYRGLGDRPPDIHKFGEALDRSVEILASGKLTAEERKITARVIELCRRFQARGRRVAHRQGGRDVHFSHTYRSRLAQPAHLGARDGLPSDHR